MSSVFKQCILIVGSVDVLLPHYSWMTFFNFVAIYVKYLHSWPLGSMALSLIGVEPPSPCRDATQLLGDSDAHSASGVPPLSPSVSSLRGL